MSRGIGRLRAQRRIGPAGWQRKVATALVVLAAVLGFAAWKPHTRRPNAVVTTRWRSDSATQRLTWSPIVGNPPLGVSGFAVARGHLYLADRVGSQVLQLSSTARGGWQVDSAVAAGPIEGPLSLAVDRDSTLVLYDSRRMLVRIGAEGAGVVSMLPDLPCTLGEGQIGFVDGARVLLSGTCADVSGDTVLAVALTSSDSGRHFTLRQRAPLYARDGSWGSVIYAIRFAVGSSRSIDFGIGSQPCLVRFTWKSSRNERVCGLLAAFYSASQPPSFVALETARRQLGMAHPTATAWPNPLTPFFDHVVTDSGPAFVRLVTGDSVEIQLHPSSGPMRSLLVAPLKGFRGCSGARCLWVRQIGSSVSIGLVDVAALAEHAADSRMETPR
jgi:hypothetical protein